MSGFDDVEAYMAADAEAPTRPDRQEFPGTVANYNLGLNSASVVLDDGGGDFEVPSLVGALTVGQRVMVGFEPPHWCAVTGIVSAPVIEPPPTPDPTPWIELVDSGITVNNGGGSVSISWDSATAGGGVPAATWWTSGSSIAIPIAGVYLVSCYGEWDLETTGFRQMHIRKNGTIVRIDHREGDADDGPPQGLAFPLRFAAGDLVRFSCFYLAGGGPASLGIDNLQASITYLAPAT